jgi:hypothetical protein
VNPHAETFPGAACYETLNRATIVRAFMRAVLQRSKAAPLQAPRALSPVRLFARSPFCLLAQYLEGLLDVIRAQNQKPAFCPG